MHDWFPPVVAANGRKRLYGWEAIAVQDQEGWTLLRSPKRLLRTVGPKTIVQIGGEPLVLQQLMAEMMSSLRMQLLEHSNLGAEAGQPALRVERTYKPAHNIGHFRYLECSRLDGSGQPIGEITNWEQIQFPFDPQLENVSDLAQVPVQPMIPVHGMLAREVYTCDANGSISVAVSSQLNGHSREYVLGHLQSTKR